MHAVQPSTLPYLHPFLDSPYPYPSMKFYHCFHFLHIHRQGHLQHGPPALYLLEQHLSRVPEHSHLCLFPMFVSLGLIRLRYLTSQHL